MSLREGVLYRPLVWSVSVFLLASGVLLAIQMIAAVIGPFRLRDIGARDPRARVALWLPEEGAVAAQVARWRHWLPGPAELRAAPALAALDPGQAGAVLLADPRGLDAAGVRALERYAAAGGGVVVTGAVGVRGASGEWLGWDSMRALLGGVEVTPVEAERTVALVAVRRGPLSAPLAPGRSLAIQPEAGMPGVATADAELRWGQDAFGAPGPAATLRRSLGAGRIVWLAVGPERAAPGLAGELPLAGVLEAALAWAARRPVVEVLAWPGGAPFAASLAPEPAGAARAEWRAALDSARASGGHAWLRIETGSDALPDALAEVARTGGWLATRRELSAWVRRRSSLQATLQSVGPKRLLVAVSNRSPEPVRGAVVRVHMNQPTVRAEVATTALLQRRPELRLRSGEERLDLRVPELGARRSTAFTIDYEVAGSG
ncbi:MAG TPA: hypothetical protein VLC53_10525 [Myxococcota bacterium]|nr:hypothetical protein [Myxococcota bacterium]